MEKLLSPTTTPEELKKYFEELYWKCPDIITHITICFKHLYYQNQKKFTTYYDNQTKYIIEKKEEEQYQTLYKAKETQIKESPYLLQKAFLEGTLNINNYTKEQITKITNTIITTPAITEPDIQKLYHSLNEYKTYLDLNYIIEDIKKLYKEKEKYKGQYQIKKKIVEKQEKKLFQANKKLIKQLSKRKEAKIELLSSQINKLIITLKQDYEELEKNQFLEEISNLKEDTTLYDILLLASSNYNYLIELMKKEDKQDLEKLKTYIHNPHNTILDTILISEEKELNILIMDRYNLFGFNITKENLEKENIDTTIQDLEKILNSIQMNKYQITEKNIKFLKETEKIA